MKPIVAKPEQTFQELIEEINKITTKEQFKRQIEQIIAKYQRKKKRLEKELKEKGSGDYSKMISALQNLEAGRCSQIISKTIFTFSSNWISLKMSRAFNLSPNIPTR